MNALIFGLENSTLIPYFLYLLKNDSKNSNELEYISKYLETYILRRIICKKTSKNYNQLFTERFIGNRMLTHSKLKKYIEEQSEKTNNMPSNSDLKYGFTNSKLINKQAAGVLYFIESKIRKNSLHSTALLGQNRYSLEHIMPKKWINNWSSLDSEELKIKRNRTLLTLGNLTIITASLNSSIRDSSWKVKKEGIKNRKGLHYYSSGIETFAEFLGRDSWDETTIKERAEYLFENACLIWALPEKNRCSIN